MAFCAKCGKEINDGQKFCPGCGAPANGGAANATTNATAGPAIDLSDKLANITKTADNTAEFDPKDMADNKVFAIFAYIGILVLVPLFGASDSKFARYHANQGLVLFLIEIAWAIVSVILAFIPILGWLVIMLGNLCILAEVVMGIVNVATNKAKALPVIGNIKLLK